MATTQTNAMHSVINFTHNKFPLVSLYVCKAQPLPQRGLLPSNYETVDLCRSLNLTSTGCEECRVTNLFKYYYSPIYKERYMNSQRSVRAETPGRVSQ